MRLKAISSAAWRSIRSKWYWMLALLLLSVLLCIFLGIKLAIAVFILGIITIIGFKPESFFAAGIVVSILMGIFLAARAESLELDAAKIAFALMCTGTLLGAWSLWTTAETDKGSLDDEGEV